MEEQNITIDFSLLDVETHEENEAFAAISLNPAVTWAKFVLTDDKPNLNKRRIPESEFDNIIKTGIFMPIKMATGRINDGHEESLPIGVISHLKKVGNQIQGLAALWQKERPNDVNLIKERYQNKQPLQISWEMLFTETANNEDGVVDLKDVALRAVTLVGMPAYGGRTPITEVASINETSSEENKLELEQLQKQLEELQASLTVKDTEIAARDTELASAKAELETLREFKAGIEREKERVEKITSIKTKFSEAGINKDETYFTEKEQMLFSMSPEMLDYMIQEMVAFASTNERQPQDASNSSVKVPPLDGKKTDLSDISKIARGLREGLKK